MYLLGWKAIEPNAGVRHPLTALRTVPTTTMAPTFSLPLRTKPSAEPTRRDGRITKARKRCKSTTKEPLNPVAETTHSLAAITLKVADLQLSANQTALTNNEIGFFASQLAGTRRDIGRSPKFYPSTDRRRKHSRTTDRPSLITSDAAGDALASFKRLNLENNPSGFPIFVSFYSLDTLEELTNGIVVMSNEADDLIDLTTIMLRRRRAFFRESDLTKRPPLMWRFTVHYRHVENTFYDDNPNEGKLVVHYTCSETCIAPDVQTDHGGSQTARPDEAYSRFLTACKDQDVLKMLVDEYEGKDTELTYGRRWNEPFNTKMFSDETDEVLGSVSLWFR